MSPRKRPLFRWAVKITLLLLAVLITYKGGYLLGHRSGRDGVSIETFRQLWWTALEQNPESFAAPPSENANDPFAADPFATDPFAENPFSFPDDPFGE